MLLGFCMALAAFLLGCAAARSSLTESAEQMDYLAVLQAGEPQQLTSEDATDIEPKWAPNGRTLAFASDRTGSWNVWSVPVEGGEPTQLTTDLHYVHSTWWSSDGKSLALAASERHGSGFIGYIYMLDVREGDMKRVTDGPVDGVPCFSPDDSLLAFVSNRSGSWDVWVQSPHGGDPRQITVHEGMDHSPRWSPDGTRLAFHSDRSGNGDIWIYEFDSGTITQATASPAFDHYPTWSPDGQYIAFHSNRGGAFDIWVIPVEGGQAVQVTSGPHNDMRPVWSPDGTAIAFNSDRSGSTDIWTLTPRP